MQAMTKRDLIEALKPFKDEDAILIHWIDSEANVSQLDNVYLVTANSGPAGSPQLNCGFGFGQWFERYSD